MRALIALILTTTPALAQDAPSLEFPVDCTLGETCMIQQLVDHDPTGGVRDFRCGSMSYDGHQGTDIRVPDMEALAEGVGILAATSGTVLGTRNSVPDTGIGGFPEGQDCGNGVVIAHENGWQTQYCHLAQGSVLVTEGEFIEASQLIGNMGFSGRTEFPHLHVTVRQNGDVIDPFAPTSSNTCGPSEVTLWADNLPLPSGGILSIGFASSVPTYEEIQAGTADVEDLPATGEAIVIWGFFYGGRAGDIMSARIFSPDGSAYHTQEITLDRTQAQLFRATGRRIRDALPSGTYTGTVSLTRDGTEIDTETTTISVR